MTKPTDAAGARAFDKDLIKRLELYGPIQDPAATIKRIKRSNRSSFGRSGDACE